MVVSTSTPLISASPELIGSWQGMPAPGPVMAVQSFSGSHHMHMGHLWGDVPALILVAVVLAVLVRAADLRQPAAAV